MKDASALTVLNVLLRHRRLIVALALAGGLLAAIVTKLMPDRFTSTTTFMPHAGSSTASPYAAVAAQFGITRMGSDPSSSPEFYVDLLRSPTILQTAVEKNRRFADARARQTAMRRLARSITTKVEPKTSVVTLRVTADSAAKAQRITAHLVDLLNDFDRNIRKSQAAAEREMLEQRQAEARESLNTAERRLLGFMMRNRNYNNAPQLTFEFERLSREVAARQQLYLTLAESYEKAKIDEIRDTPVITVIEAATLPVEPDPDWTILKAIIGAIVGALLAIFIAFVRTAAQRHARDGSRDVQDFQLLWRETVLDVRRPWKVFTFR